MLQSLCFVLNWFSNRTGTSDGRECCFNLTIFGNLHVQRSPWSSDVPRSLAKSAYSLNPENLDWSRTLKPFLSLYLLVFVLGFACVVLVS